MTAEAARDRLAFAGGVDLLERAMGYTLGTLAQVTPADYGRPTPCTAWNLRALLAHMNDSLAVLHEAMAAGSVPAGPHGFADPAGQYGDPEQDPVGSLRDRGCQMLGSWVNASRLDLIRVGDRFLTPEIISAAGAVEIAVHGWDVARACGQARPLPEPLADDLIPFGPLLVSAGERPSRFGPVRQVSQRAPASERLLAFLGRRAN